MDQKGNDEDVGQQQVDGDPPQPRQLEVFLGDGRAPGQTLLVVGLVGAGACRRDHRDARAIDCDGGQAAGED